MTKRIFRSILGVAVAVLFVSAFVTTVVMASHMASVVQKQLRGELELAVKGVELSGEEYLEAQDSLYYRLTWIDTDGTVLYDTAADLKDVQDHTNRKEIQEAFKHGYGESRRYSDTLRIKMSYAAQALSDGTVLRIAVSMESQFVLIANSIVSIAAIVLSVVLLSAVLARHLAKGVVKPLESLDLEHPSDDEVYEELSPLLRKIAKQRRQIEEKALALRKKEEEFEQIIASMNEGLVLLDPRGAVISMNPAAKRLFDITDDPHGHEFVTLDHSIRMAKAIEDALCKKPNEFCEHRKEAEYRFVISPIVTDNRAAGAVILCFDVTQAALAEQTRQEFTANVSHELKTPLQSIIGSAELLQSGLVKSEDTGRFVGNIKDEACRLVTLINDIIRLSELDENAQVLMESVELYGVAEEVIETLSSSADKRRVRLCLKGKRCVVQGIRRYMYEILYNLCDNAIRYNREGGQVTLEVVETASGVALVVTDTGIGIPQEHLPRIFERFYRVDKSHSKETGGTGLGLSIVKHAVAFHNGTVKLESVVGVGTTVTVNL